MRLSFELTLARLAAAAIALAALVPGSAWAQADTVPAAPAALSGTLAKVRDSGVVAIGYRESSVPFSYMSSKGMPIGYSIELCRGLVEGLSAALHKPLGIKWVQVTADSRIDAVAGGQVDLECGSTTNNLERQKRVAFSPTMFISGTKLLVKNGSPIKSFRDLSGKTVAVTRGTTNAVAMKSVADKFKLDVALVVQPDHADSFKLVQGGQADAFATDDVLLYGLIAQAKAQGQGQGQYQVVGEFLSYEPYAVMFRKGDPQMQAVVEDTFRAMATDGEIARQYERWFLQKLPSGVSLDLPMSPQLETLLQTLAARPE